MSAPVRPRTPEQFTLRALALTLDRAAPTRLDERLPAPGGPVSEVYAWWPAGRVASSSRWTTER